VVAASPTIPLVSVSTATNCREGPSTDFAILASLVPGQFWEVEGKNTALQYWIVRIPGGSQCWLWGQYATVIGNIAGLPEIPAPPLPATATPAVPKPVTNLTYVVACQGAPPFQIFLGGTLLGKTSPTRGRLPRLPRDTLVATLGPGATIQVPSCRHGVGDSFFRIIYPENSNQPARSTQIPHQRNCPASGAASRTPGTFGFERMLSLRCCRLGSGRLAGLVEPHRRQVEGDSGQDARFPGGWSPRAAINLGCVIKGDPRARLARPVPANPRARQLGAPAPTIPQFEQPDLDLLPDLRRVPLGLPSGQSATSLIFLVIVSAGSCMPVRGSGPLPRIIR
jgi:hypothetical protein